MLIFVEDRLHSANSKQASFALVCAISVEGHKIKKLIWNLKKALLKVFG